MYSPGFYFFISTVHLAICFPSEVFDSRRDRRYIDENGLLRELRDYIEDGEYYYEALREKRRGELEELELPPSNDVYPLERPARNCACMCRRKYGASACCACTWAKSVCFPASATVTLESGDTVRMTQLREGQKVLSATENGELIYSEVRIYLKRSVNTLSSYLTLETSRASISLSESHVIFTAENSTNKLSTKFAGDVKVGDKVWVNSNDTLEPVIVKHVHRMNMKGVYVPLTETGTIVVDGVLASCYASFDHWLSHFFLAPLRWWPRLFGAYRIQDDMPAFVYVVKEIGHFLLPPAHQTNWLTSQFSPP